MREDIEEDLLLWLPNRQMPGEYIYGKGFDLFTNCATRTAHLGKSPYCGILEWDDIKAHMLRYDYSAQ